MQTKDLFELFLICTNLFTFFFVLIKGLINIYLEKKIDYLKISCETYNHYENGLALYLNIVSEKPININKIYLSLNNDVINSKKITLGNCRGIDYSCTSLDKLFPLFRKLIFLEPFIVNNYLIVFKNDSLKDFNKIIQELEINFDLLFSVKKIKVINLIKNSISLKKYLKEYYIEELNIHDDDIDDVYTGIETDID